MGVRVHINPETNKRGYCKAKTVEGCQFAKEGEIPPHFDSMKEAAAYIAEKEAEGQSELPQGLSKQAKKTVGKQQEELDDLEAQSIKPGHIEELEMTRGFPTPQMFATLGPVKSITTEQSGDTGRLILSNGKQDIVYYTYGDCCSHSYVQLPKKGLQNFKKGKKVAEVSFIPDEKETKVNKHFAEPLGDVISTTTYEIRYEDGSTDYFRDVNDSNGFYSSLSGWSLKPATK